MLFAHAMPIAMRMIGGTCFAALALVFGSLGIFMLRRMRRLATRGSRTEGVIVGAEPTSGVGESGIHWYPRVAFETAHGEKIEFVDDRGWNTPPEIGRKVKVTYLPERPSEAEIPSVVSWIGCVGCVVFAAMFVVLSVVFYFGMVGS